MTKWWDRVAERLHARDMRPVDLARATGINPKLIYKYLDGKVDNPRGETLRQIAIALGTTEQELLYGTRSNDASVKLLRGIPVSELGELGSLGRGLDHRSLWDGVASVSAPEDVSSNAFGVKLTDESNEPDFSSGEIIICEPNVSCIPGRYVVAVRKDLQQAYFGRYQPVPSGSPDSFRVVPRNEFFPPITFDSDHPGFIVARATIHLRRI